MLPSVLSWLQSTDFFTSIRQSAYTYPVILSLHMVALAFFGGMIIVTDVRLLGLGMRSYSVSEIVDGLRVPKRFGFVFAVTCGLLMFGSKAEQYYYNPWFRIKVTLLALIALNYLIFRSGVYNNAVELDRAPQMPGRAKLAAALSLLLWTSVACAGRGIGYIDPVVNNGSNALRSALQSGSARTIDGNLS